MMLITATHAKVPARLMVLLLGMLAGFLVSGCAGPGVKGDVEGENHDPLEGPNRVVYGFNDFLDRALIAPTAGFYADHLPYRMRQGVTNFFDNLRYPGVVINDLLQGKLGRTLSDGGRFAANSTLGVAGILDVATPLGLERHDEDLGQTLGVWGFGAGPYLVLPFVGSNNPRDLPDLAASAFTNLLYYLEPGVLLPLFAVKVIDDRANLLSATRHRDETALDPYIFTRTAYRQRRTHLIHGGYPPPGIPAEEDYAP